MLWLVFVIVLTRCNNRLLSVIAQIRLTRSHFIDMLAGTSDSRIGYPIVLVLVKHDDGSGLSGALQGLGSPEGFCMQDECRRVFEQRLCACRCICQITPAGVTPPRGHKRLWSRKQTGTATREIWWPLIQEACCRRCSDIALRITNA